MTSSENPTRQRALVAVATGEVVGVEAIILRWQWQDHGQFFTALWAAIVAADEHNLRKLEDAFPDEVNAFRVWQTTWIAESLREKGYLD
jgi:hypothetical protein